MKLFCNLSNMSAQSMWPNVRVTLDSCNKLMLHWFLASHRIRMQYKITHEFIGQTQSLGHLKTKEYFQSSTSLVVDIIIKIQRTLQSIFNFPRYRRLKTKSLSFQTLTIFSIWARHLSINRWYRNEKRNDRMTVMTWMECWACIFEFIAADSIIFFLRRFHFKLMHVLFMYIYIS